MNIQNTRYPFSAIVGQENLKRALILNLVNPRIGGLLIVGERGTAKSTIVRSLMNISKLKIKELPLSVTDDRLLGSVDLENTMKEGNLVFSEGILSQADKGILYIDEVNLLQDNVVDALITATGEKFIQIEREGFSKCLDCDFIIIGTMNREEGEIRPQLMDRFGMAVYVIGSNIPEKRVEIQKRRLLYEKNPKIFISKYSQEDEMLEKNIIKAAELVKEVKLTESNYFHISALCIKAGVQGHRADIILEQTAKAIAAFDGRKNIHDEDIEEAAEFVLIHRKRQSENENKNNMEDNDKENKENEDKDDENENRCENREDECTNESQEQNNVKNHENDKDDEQKEQNREGSGKKQIFSIGDEFSVKDFSHKSDRRKRKGSGKRTAIRNKTKSGRYIFSTMERNNDDLALDATLRAAAPFQRIRKKDNLAVKIEKQDIREKVRQRKNANLLVFVVDASGSMGAFERMQETKGAILSLLKDAYVKRDKISLITFNGEEAKVLLPPTRSVQRGFTLLEKIETGGKTPLNAGIEKGIHVINSELRKSPDIMPTMVIITDGKGNISCDENLKPKDELFQLAEKIKQNKEIDSMVIDIERSGMMNFEIAKKLATVLEAKYYKMDKVKKEQISELIKNMA